MKELDQGYEFTKAQLAELEQLRQRVAELEDLVPELEIARNERQIWSEKYYASQLDNLRLRECLLKAISTCFDRASYERHMSDPSYFTNQALSTPTPAEALEKYLADRLGEPVAWRGMTGHGVVISVNPPSIQPDKWTPLYYLKEKP